MDLSKLNMTELQTLRREIDAAIGDFEVRKKREAYAAIAAQAKEFGFALSDLFPGVQTKRAPSTVKYANPQNQSQTWSGRGRKPEWFVVALASGKTHEDLRIN